MKVTLEDASGGALVTDQRTLTAISAGGTFYVGGETQTTVPPSTVVRLQVRVRVGSTQRRRLVLPRVRDTSTSTDNGEGWRVSGVFTNPYKRAMYVGDGSTCSVVFDSHGTILGGLCENGILTDDPATEEIPPGATVGVAVSLSDFPEVTAHTASGRISVDPGSEALG